MTQEIMRHELPGVQRYVALLQQEVERREQRHADLKRIETSAAGRAAVLRFAGYSLVVVLIALAFLFGRWAG